MTTPQIANPSTTGWRVYANPGRLDLWFRRSGMGILRARVVKGKLTPLDVKALQAIQLPTLVSKVPRRSRVTCPRRYRGQDNQGKNRRAFVLSLGGRPAVEIRLVGNDSLIGTGLIEALQHRINRRQRGDVPLPPAFLKAQKEKEDGLQRAQGQHRVEEVQPDPEEPGPRSEQGLDQAGELQPALELDQEPVQQVGA